MAVRHILLDTNAYAAFKQGKTAAIEVLQYTPFIGMSSVVIGELLSGFAIGTRETVNRQELKLFLASPRIHLLPLDENTAEHYAGIYRQLKRKGQPIPTNDMWIAAAALQHGLAVFSYDNHFQAIEGLIIGHRLSDFIF